MVKKLYIGNLSYNTTEAQLRELFAQAGEVSTLTLITDRETGRAKGFGFIEMSDDAQADEAIRRFNGHMLDDRALTVNEARPREERSGGGFGGGRRDNNFSSKSDRNGYDRNRNRF